MIPRLQGEYSLHLLVHCLWWVLRCQTSLLRWIGDSERGRGREREKDKDGGGVRVVVWLYVTPDSDGDPIVASKRAFGRHIHFLYTTLYSAGLRKKGVGTYADGEEGGRVTYIGGTGE